MEKKNRADMKPMERFIYDYFNFGSPCMRRATTDVVVVPANDVSGNNGSDVQSKKKQWPTKKVGALIVGVVCAAASVTWFGLPWGARNRGTTTPVDYNPVASVNGHSYDATSFNRLLGLHDLSATSRRTLVKAATEMRGFKGFVCEVLPASVSFNEWDGLLKSLFLSKEDWATLEKALLAPQY